MKQGTLFYVAQADREPTGPFDEAQIIALLSEKRITAQTMIRQNAVEGWKPLALYPQFTSVEEMRVETAATSLDVSVQEANAPNLPIPLPSAALMRQVWRAVFLMTLGMVSAYLFARADVTTGICLMVIFGGASCLAHAILLGKLLDEGYSTFILVMAVPFFDIYYFLSNMDAYRSCLFVKYGGAVLFMAAAIGFKGNPLVH